MSVYNNFIETTLDLCVNRHNLRENFYEYADTFFGLRCKDSWKDIIQFSPHNRFVKINLNNHKSEKIDFIDLMSIISKSLNSYRDISKTKIEKLISRDIDIRLVILEDVIEAMLNRLRNYRLNERHIATMRKALMLDIHLLRTGELGSYFELYDRFIADIDSFEKYGYFDEIIKENVKNFVSIDLLICYAEANGYNFKRGRQIPLELESLKNATESNLRVRAERYGF